MLLVRGVSNTMANGSYMFLRDFKSYDIFNILKVYK